MCEQQQDNNAKYPTVLVLDGGFSSQLSTHVGVSVDGDPLWTARFVKSNPDDVLNTHLDFLRAGADIIMTNTYQASISGFVKYLKVTKKEAYNLIVKAVTLANCARDIFINECRQNGTALVRKPLIVGSVGPYGAYLHDGSEYNGSYADVTDAKTMKEWHTPRIKALIEAGVDLLAFETMPCFKEAQMLVEYLKEFPKVKAWLSFSCKDEESLSHGENFKETLKTCWDLNPDQLVAVGANCCSPKLVAHLFKGINDDRTESPIPLITYPNSGETYSPGVGWVDTKCERLDSFVHEWLDLGVRYVGGCCRTYSSDIAKIRAQVLSWNEKQMTKSSN